MTPGASSLRHISQLFWTRHHSKTIRSHTATVAPDFIVDSIGGRRRKIATWLTRRTCRSDTRYDMIRYINVRSTADVQPTGLIYCSVPKKNRKIKGKLFLTQKASCSKETVRVIACEWSREEWREYIIVLCRWGEWWIDGGRSDKWETGKRLMETRRVGHNGRNGATSY